MPYPSRDLEPQILAPLEEETKFKDLKPSETGAYQANQDRWVAAEEYAKSLGAKQNADKPLAPGTTGLPANPAVRAEAAKQRSEFQKNKLNEANAKVATWNSRLAIPVKNYPTLAKAMMQDPTLTEADVRRLVNFSAAWTAADAISSAVTAQSQTNIFMSLPEAQRYVVQDILKSRDDAIRDSRERAKRDQRLAEEEQATWGPARQLTAGFGQGVADLATGFMRGVDNIYDTVSHTLAAYQYGKVQAQRSGETDMRIEGYGLLDPFFYWSDTEDGKNDNAVIDQARKEYGDIPVDLILEIKQASLEGDTNPIMTISEKYVNDPVRADYIAMLTKRVMDDPEMQKRQDEILSLADKLDTASTSDLGAMVTTNNPVTGEPVDANSPWRGSMLQQGLSKSINVTAAMTADPLIGFGKGLRFYKSVRYGLDKLASTAGAETVEKALSMPSVRGYITNLTDDVAKYNSMRAAGESTSKFGKAMTNRYKDYFPQDLIMDLAKAEVHTPEEFLKYVQDSNRMAQIARAEAAGMEEVGILGKGAAARKIADINQQTVFGRMYGQQGARRGAPLLPQNRILALDNTRRTITNYIAGLGSKKTREDELKALFRDANDESKSFGMMLNERAPQLGEEARLGAQGLSPAKNVAALWDKTTRFVSTTPGKQAIYTKDARDTDVFYKFARMHLPKHQAQLLADEWRNGTQAERVLMWIGTVRSATYARGFEDIKDMMLVLPNKKHISVGEYVKTLSVGTRDDVRFSPDSVSIVDGENVIPLSKYLEDMPMTTGVTAADFNVGTVGENILRSSPSDFNGIEHPLHLWQTSDYLSIPNMNELQRITKRNAMINAVRNHTGGQSIASEIVNYWSLLNLVGPKYATRNALEDWTLYALTGGYLMDAVKGSAMGKGIREARGARTGIFSRFGRKVGGQEAEQGGGAYSFWNYVVKPNLNKDEIAAARLAADEGDLTKLRDLSLRATLRLESGKLLSPIEEQYLVDFVSSHAAYTKLDEITETTHHLGNGTVPGVDTAGGAAPGIIGDESLMVYPRGEYTDVAMSGNNMARFTYWHRNIRNTIVADGTIGKLAVQNLDDVELATRLVAQELARDTKFGYKQRLAAFYDMRTAVSDDEFARRYVQDVFNLFSRQDGSLNKPFWSKFVMVNDDGTRITRFATQSNGKWEAPLSVSDLQKMNVKDMPKYVLGRETQLEAIRIDMSLSDKIWTAMGNTVNRISKEPIFFGNYLRARKQLAKYEEQLSLEIGDDLARETVTRHALDRATSVTLAYTDNPANQTILAWRLRNWARYYRATEDFYRRVYRMGKFEPIGFYKAALTLNALEDQGFIHTDEYGDKYFMYPGDGLVNNIMGRVTSLFMGGNNMFIGATPLVFSGKVKMLAPSFDPNSAVPALSGPLAALSVKTLINIFPQFGAIEKYALGEYAVGKAIPQSVLPASVLRFMAALNQDERETMYASAYISAVKVLTAAGKMPDLVEGNEDEALRAVGTVSSNILVARLVNSFWYQASPQVTENDVTTFARRYGIPSMSAEHRARVEKFRKAGETDPYGMAMQEGVSIYGYGYTVYDVSKSERGKELKQLPELNYIENIFSFADDNSQVIKKYPASAYFLAPTEAGEFSLQALDYFKEAGLSGSVDASKYARNVKYAEGQYRYRSANRAYRKAVEEATSPEDVSNAKNTWKIVQAKIFGEYPGLQAYQKETLQMGGWEAEAINRNNPGSVRRMVEDYYAGKFGPIPKSVKYIAESLSTYDYFTTQKSQITGSSEPERLAKNSFDSSLARSLQAISKDDPNAAMFIRQVLYVLIDADSEGNLR